MAKKILIIEDMPEIIDMLVARLTVHGFEVAFASDGECGFEKARKFLPDIILMDVVMPGWSGFETAKHLKTNLSTADIPIIFLTGLTNESVTKKYLENGGYHVLLKPFKTEELLTILADDFNM